MNLILSLKELWRRRALVGAAAAGAAFVSVLVVYQVSLFPPSASKRVDENARGSVEILVDSARSPIADARRDLTGLIARAGVFARYIAGGNVIGQIAEVNGIPVGQIDVAGPEALPGEVPGTGPESPQIHPYGISIVQSGELPILTVVTRAPTVKRARGLAAAAPAAIRNVVRRIQAQQETPLDKRVQFRVLGPAEAAPDEEALGKKFALALFLFLFAVFIVSILAVPRLLAAWRDADPDGAARAEPGEDFLHLAPERSGEADGDDPVELDRAAGET